MGRFHTTGLNAVAEIKTGVDIISGIINDCEGEIGVALNRRIAICRPNPGSRENEVII